MESDDIFAKLGILKSLEAYSEEELKRLRESLIMSNVHDNCRDEELEGIRNVTCYIEYIIKEESALPYPPGYHHPLTEELLKSLNHIILEKYMIYQPFEKGNYRLGNNDKIGDIVLPSREIFIPRLQELIRWYENTTDDFFDKITDFHLIFLCEIHPFYDGNGRTARTFLNLELSRYGLPMIGLKYPHEEEYYNAFDEYNHNRDKNPMKRLILKSIDEQLDRCLSLRKSS